MTSTDARLLALLGESRALGFLGPGPVERQLEHARAFLSLLGAPASVVDLGAGGGVPGLVLAALLPDVRFVLVEAQRRRAAFLRSSATANVEVVEGRAEDVGRSPEHRESHDAVVARSFGAPAVTAECAAPLLRVGGRLIVSDPPQEEATRWPVAELAGLGLAVGGQRAAPALTRLDKVAPIDPRFPRAVGRPAKRPLW